MNWFIPSFRTKPYYEEFVSLINAIDATAYDHESRIDVLEHSGPGGAPYESDVVPVVEHLIITGDLSNWKGKTFDNTGAALPIVITINDTDVPEGSKCRIIQTDLRKSITIKPAATFLLTLPDNINLDDTESGITINGLFAEIEIAKETTFGGSVCFRIIVNHGHIHDIDNDKDYYLSTDGSPPVELSEAYVIPKVIELTSDLSISDWNGYTIQNTNPGANRKVTLESTDVVVGSKCRIAQTHSSFRIELLPPVDTLFYLPDGVMLDTVDGLRSMAKGSELDLLFIIDDLGAKYCRIIMHGVWKNIKTNKVYYASTDAIVETGTGSKVFATSPTLVTPILGVATATSINKVEITQPADSAVLTIDNKKTFRAKNSIILAGVDGKELTVNHSVELYASAAGSTKQYFPARNSNLLAEGLIQVLNTSADDNSVTLDNTNFSENIVVRGSHSNYMIDLGDATTYQISDKDTKCFNIVNGASNIIGIKNSDDSVWLRLFPGWIARFVLENKSSAAGIWKVTIIPCNDRRKEFYDIDDFLGFVSIANPLGLTSELAGADAAIDSSCAVFHGDALGILELDTGSTATGRASVKSQAWYYPQIGPKQFRIAQLPTNLPDASDDFWIRIGFMNSDFSAQPTDGMYLEHLGSSNSYWRYCAANASTRTENDSSKTIDVTNFRDFIVEQNHVLSRCDYWIDKTHLGYINTNLPGYSVGLYHGASFVRTAYTSNRKLLFDAMAVYYGFNSARW
jgi:hypothetical protein